MPEKIELVRGSLADLKALQALYVSTIMTVCANEYSEAERKAWASGIDRRQRWEDMLSEQLVLMALINGQLSGFITLLNGDYIDFLYVHKDFQGEGIASMLLQAIEKEARHCGTTTLFSDVSKTARPFFEFKGFHAIRENRHERPDDVILVNYRMSKLL